MIRGFFSVWTQPSLSCVTFLPGVMADVATSGERIVAMGTPEEVARVKESYTGRFLKEELNGPATRKKG